jgi:hypothetical protein
VFFDEINRAHPRVLNAILEIIQFKSVNGAPLKNLKMVWAAMNPPTNEYNVEDLDPALVDRFHVFMKMDAVIDVKYLSSKMKKETAEVLKSWWEFSLSEEQRAVFTPRRIEYVGMMIDKKIPWRDSFPAGHFFPVEDLDQKLRDLNSGEVKIEINKNNILSDKKYFLDKVKEDPKSSILISQVMQKFSEEELFCCRDILEALPKELVKKIAQNKFSMRRHEFIQMFNDNKVNLGDYPKIAFGYGANNE